MNVETRLILMMRMLRENFDDALQRKSRENSGNYFQNVQEKQLMETEVKKVVCEVGISMYRVRKRFDNLYNTAIGNQALHEAIEKGIKQDWLKRGQLKNYPEEEEVEQRNIVLTEKGFERIFEKGFEEIMTMTHSIHVAAAGGLRR